MQPDDSQDIFRQSKDQLIVLIFTAPWSGASNMLGNTFERLRKDYTKLQVISCNAGDYPEMTSSFGIADIPTTLLIYQSEIVDSFVGPLSLKRTKERIIPYL